MGTSFSAPTPEPVLNLSSCFSLRHVFLILASWLLARCLSVVVAIVQATKRSEAAPEEAVMELSAASGPSLVAGASLPRVETPSPGTRVEHAWCKLHASNFHVRSGPDYSRNKLKTASQPALGEVVAIDVFRTQRKMHNLLQLNHIEPPAPTTGWSEPYPEFFIVNQQLPVHFNHSIFAGPDADGETLNLISYIRMRAGIGRGWCGSAEPRGAEELLKRFLMRAEQDPSVAHCLKEIGIILNLADVTQSIPSALARLLKRFNGKPVLTRPEHTFYREPTNRWLTVDVDGHQYMYTTRSALALGIRSLRELVLGYGLLVEARAEQEMPEVMASSCMLLRLDPDRCQPFPPER
jgi:hypothetical protein